MKILYFREVNKMLTKKKKIFIVLGMVALLVVTGCLNLFLSNNDSVVTNSYESASFLTSYRESKYETRQTMTSIYQSIIDTSTDKEEIEETYALLKELAARAEEENSLEWLVMSSGFEDCVVTNLNGTYTVMVKSDGLTSSDVATILSILVKETGVSATNVKVSSV